MNKYGWVPDHPDHRDFSYVAKRHVIEALPPSADLRASCPPAYDQGNLGSCTANALGAAHQYDQMRQAEVGAFMPSRLFIYYNERVIEHTINSDAGAMLRDGIKTIVSQGVCPEKSWPYVLSKFASKPPKVCYSAALKSQGLIYQRLDQTDLLALKGCLGEGLPFVFGFSVYESFETAEVATSGVAPMPGVSERLLGGHAVMAVGYDDYAQRFLVRNSWGVGWGQQGYFTMPYAYLTNVNLAADFWCLRTVE